MTTIEKKIQKKVDEINNLISLASNSESENAYDGNLMVTDTSSTWEEPAVYKPIIFRNGVLYIEYFEPYSNRTKKDKILKRDLEYDGYGTLLDIAKIYRKALKKENIKYAGGGEFMTDPTFGNFQNNIYADGGKFSKIYVVEYEVNGNKKTSEYLLYENDRVEKMLPSNAKIISIKEKFATGGGVGNGYVESYYNESISGGDNGYQVNLMFYKNLDDEDYFDEEYITTSSPKKAEELSEKINKLGYEGFLPMNKYANGGVTENYVSRRNLNTITIKKGNQKLTYKISDVLNGAYKLESGAKLEDIAFYVPKRNIVKVQLKTGKDFKPANGYWIKDGAKPIHVTKFDDGGNINNLSREEFIKKEIDSQKQKEKSITFKKYKVNVFEEGYPFVEPLMTDNFIEAINFAKKTIESQRRYRNTSKDLFAEIDKFQPIEQRGNVRYPYYSFASFSEEDLKTSKFDEGGKVNSFTNKDGIRVRSKVEPKEKMSEKEWMAKHNSSKEARSYMAGGSIRDIKWANVDNRKLGVWLLTSVDGNAILNKSKNASELEKNVMDYYKKRGSVARMTWDDDADDGLSWVTFTDLYNEIKLYYMDGGKTETPTKKGKGNHKMKATTDLARKIRKEGEKWTDAIKRASLQLK